MGNRAGITAGNAWTAVAAVCGWLLSGACSNAADLARISAGWHRWGSTDDGWFLIPTGGVIARG